MKLNKKLKFLTFIIMTKTGMAASLIRFKFKELDDLILTGSMKIIESKKSYFKTLKLLYCDKKVN